MLKIWNHWHLKFYEKQRANLESIEVRPSRLYKTHECVKKLNQTLFFIFKYTKVEIWNLKFEMIVLGTAALLYACFFYFISKKMARRTSELLKTASSAIVLQRTRETALTKFKDVLGLF